MNPLSTIPPEPLPTPEENLAIAVIQGATEDYDAYEVRCMVFWGWGPSDKVAKKRKAEKRKVCIGPSPWHDILGLVPEFMERVLRKIDRGEEIDWHAVRMRRLN